jgi:hypothetical protein
MYLFGLAGVYILAFLRFLLEAQKIIICGYGVATLSTTTKATKNGTTESAIGSRLG